MESRVERAKELFMEGCNCSQAVFVAYCDLYGIDHDMAMRLSASFGGGMGRMREVCGAVSGMFLIAGLETGAVKGANQEAKKHNYEVVQQLAERFRQQYGSIICRELLGLNKTGTPKDMTAPTPEKRTEAYYKKRPCKEQIMQAAKILEETILVDRFNQMI